MKFQSFGQLCTCVVLVFVWVPMPSQGASKWVEAKLGMNCVEACAWISDDSNSSTTGSTTDQYVCDDVSVGMMTAIRDPSAAMWMIHEAGIEGIFRTDSDTVTSVPFIRDGFVEYFRAGYSTCAARPSGNYAYYSRVCYCSLVTGAPTPAPTNTDPENGIISIVTEGPTAVPSYSPTVTASTNKTTATTTTSTIATTMITVDRNITVGTTTATVTLEERNLGFPEHDTVKMIIYVVVGVLLVVVVVAIVYTRRTRNKSRSMA